MSNIIIYDLVTGAVKQYFVSVNTPDYDGRNDVLINPDFSDLAAVPIEYLKVVEGQISEMTAEEKAAVDAARPVQEPGPIEIIQSAIDNINNNLQALNVQFPSIAAQFPPPPPLKKG